MIAFFMIYESQARGSLHFHGLFWGGIPPSILQFAADKPALSEKIRMVIDSVVKCYVSDDIQKLRFFEMIHNRKINDNNFKSNSEDGEKQKVIKAYRPSLEIYKCLNTNIEVSEKLKTKIPIFLEAEMNKYSIINNQKNYCNLLINNCSTSCEISE
jgi:hypothetical protein